MPKSKSKQARRRIISDVVMHDRLFCSCRVDGRNVLLIPQTRTVDDPVYDAVVEVGSTVEVVPDVGIYFGRGAEEYAAMADLAVHLADLSSARLVAELTTARKASTL